MARLALNKSSMAKQSNKLKLYKEVLPALDMKRQQLLIAQAKARAELAELLKKEAELNELVGAEVPMLSNKKIDLTNVVAVDDFEILEENVVGTKIPKAGKLKLTVGMYSYLSKPHWVDYAAKLLIQSIEIQLQLMVVKKRVKLLDKAALTYTQRFNLFDKVLIPKTRENIKKIKIYLSDSERAQLVNAKIAKKKKGVLV